MNVEEMMEQPLNGNNIIAWKNALDFITWDNGIFSIETRLSESKKDKDWFSDYKGKTPEDVIEDIEEERHRDGLNRLKNKY